MILALRTLAAYEWYTVAVLPVALILTMWWIDRWENR